ncbi:MAG: nitroreductase [Myxococcota bacterium]
MDPKAIDEVIQRRRTFKPASLSEREIPESELLAVLEAARWAPSHGLTEPWRFRLFRGPARKRLADALAHLYESALPADQQKPGKADNLRTLPLKPPVVALVWMARQPIEKIAELEEIEAVACAVQNVSLAAAARGIGTFWSTPPVLYLPQMNEWMGIGAKDRCLGLLYIGYPADPTTWPTGRRRPIDEKIEWVDA